LKFWTIAGHCQLCSRDAFEERPETIIYIISLTNKRKTLGILTDMKKTRDKDARHASNKIRQDMIS